MTPWGWAQPRETGLARANRRSESIWSVSQRDRLLHATLPHADRLWKLDAVAYFWPYDARSSNLRAEPNRLGTLLIRQASSSLVFLARDNYPASPHSPQRQSFRRAASQPAIVEYSIPQ